VISRGQSVYSLDRDPVPLFYGSVAPYRALYLGVSDGPDVTELQENLIALGFEHGSASDQFTYGTEADVKAWQASLGEAENGVVALGDVVLEASHRRSLLLPPLLFGQLEVDHLIGRDDQPKGRPASARHGLHDNAKRIDVHDLDEFVTDAHVLSSQLLPAHQSSTSSTK